MFFFTLLNSTFIACYLFMIFHCKYDIVFVQFLLCFLYVFFIIKHVLKYRILTNIEHIKVISYT
jgi:hypothetical protein